MSQASVIINVSDQPHMHSNGLSGTWIVPPRKSKREFGLLVVYPTMEIQDIGDQRRVTHWLKAAPLAKDIVGLRSDAAAHGYGTMGNKLKWGVFLCEAEPDLPRDLIKAIEEEREFLNDHIPDVRMHADKKTGALVAINIETDDVIELKEELSHTVQKLRERFEADCKKLVTQAEITKAFGFMEKEDIRLVNEADRMWAIEGERRNVNEMHQRACQRIGQERPWCYVPQNLVDCPGCGAKIKENILTCGQCGGWLADGIEALTNMPTQQRAKLMYPERYNVATTVAGEKVK